MSFDLKAYKQNRKTIKPVSSCGTGPVVEREPVAIIGIGCRFPGSANNPETFWQLLKDGVDAITEVPADRFDIDAFYDPDQSKPGKVVTRYGGFLNNIDMFDANFFGISPWEAARLDPQQRLLLEVAWESLEDAGQPLEKISGSQTGVFVGIYTSDYENRMFAEFDAVDLYAATGSALYSAAGRLSYAFDLRGPSMAVGTACSSSLVSAHLAVNSLRNGECDMALAGGVNLVLNAQLSIAYSKGRMLSPDGRSKFGDANANGFVRGEGCGIIILKPLQQALEHGDKIYALIVGSAMNNDGRRGHFLAPSPEGQADVLKQAYRDAGVKPNHVHYIEAHGTGTIVGDPIEIESLNQVIGENRPSERPCLAGSVKTNFGHLEAASGIAGLIKAALCIHHRQIPRSLHFNKPNPRIPWSDIKVKIQKELISLPAGTEPFTIGVNAFGLTGMNAHIVLQEVMGTSSTDSGLGVQVSDSTHAFLLPLSARGAQALSAMPRIWYDFLMKEEVRNVSLKDICYNASMRRTHHSHRFAVIGNNKEEIIEQLKKHANISAEATFASEENLEDQKNGPVFVFSGQGPQWSAMGRSLMAHEPVFREVIVHCANFLRQYANWNLLDELSADEGSSHLDQTEIAQPSIFALQMGLTQLLRSWGIEPQAVIGHSVGEVAAACAAGVFTLDEALKIVFHRGRILQKATGKGKTAAVGISVAEAQTLIESHHGRLFIAAINSPKNVTLSGEEESLLEILDKISDQEVFQRMLNVNYAFHSHHVAGCSTEMITAVNDIKPKAAGIPIISTVTGQPVSGNEFGPAYWGDNIRQTVKFAPAIDWLIANNYRTFIEISAHPVLTLSIAQCLSARNVEGNSIPTLQRKKSDQRCLLETIGTLYTNGQTINWSAIYPQPTRFVSLPQYSWNRSRHWIEGDRSHKHIEKVSSDRGLPAEPTDPAAHYYTIAWRLLTATATFEAVQLDRSAKWLIFTDQDGIGDHLTGLLQSEGFDCITVEPGEHFKILDKNKFRIHPTHADDYQRLLHELVTKRQTRLHGVIHLWSLLASKPENSDGEMPDAEALQICSSALLLCKLFGREKNSKLPRIWLITKGAQPVDNVSKSLALAQSPIWGLGRVVALEANEIWGGLVDLDPDMKARESAQHLYHEILTSDDEDQIAVRGNQRYAARLIRRQPLKAFQKTYRWRKNGAYMITGGLGQLGLKLAHWMAEQGARYFVLLSRKRLPMESTDHAAANIEHGRQKMEAIDTIRKLGAEVKVLSADVGNIEEMTAVFEKFGKEFPPLHGIVHAAGVIAPRPLADLEISDLQTVFKAKVFGTWILHELTQHLELDFLILFSSAASVLGSKDLAHYAAANHFLDTYAHYARLNNQPVLSINWGWWAGGWNDDNLMNHFSQVGLHAMSDADGMAAMQELLSADTVQSMCADIDWRTLAPIYEAKKSRPFLDEIRLAATKAVPSEQTTAFQFMEELQHALPAVRPKMLQDFIRHETAQLLGYKNPSDLDVKMGFFQIGMDSIKAVQLKTRIEAATGLDLPATLTFEYPSIMALVDYIVGVAFDPSLSNTLDAEETPVEADAATVSSKDHKQLSEDELVDLLSEKLKKVR